MTVGRVIARNHIDPESALADDIRRLVEAARMTSPCVLQGSHGGSCVPIDLASYEEGYRMATLDRKGREK